LPHTAEEIWTYLEEDEDYVQLAEMPTVETYSNGQEVLSKWSAFMSLRDNVLKANEVARENKIIGKDFEAKTTLYLSQEKRELLDSLDSDIRQILIASAIQLADLEDKPE